MTDPAGLPGLLELMVPNRPDAIFILPDDPMLAGQGALVREFAIQHRLPTLYSAREFAESGGLLTYGTSLSTGYRDAELYVDRVLRGVKPADLPVAQPTEIELTINVKTAKALGITIPQSILLRANRVIE